MAVLSKLLVASENIQNVEQVYVDESRHVVYATKQTISRSIHLLRLIQNVFKSVVECYMTHGGGMYLLFQSSYVKAGRAMVGYLSERGVNQSGTHYFSIAFKLLERYPLVKALYAISPGNYIEIAGQAYELTQIDSFAAGYKKTEQLRVLYCNAELTAKVNKASLLHSKCKKGDLRVVDVVPPKDFWVRPFPYLVRRDKYSEHYAPSAPVMEVVDGVNMDNTIDLRRMNSDRRIQYKVYREEGLVTSITDGIRFHPSTEKMVGKATKQVERMSDLFEKYQRDNPGPSLANVLSKVAEKPYEVTANITQPSLAIGEVVVAIISLIYLVCRQSSMADVFVLIANQAALGGMCSRLVSWYNGNEKNLEVMRKWYRKYASDLVSDTTSVASSSSEYSEQALSYEEQAAGPVMAISQLIATGVVALTSTQDLRNIPKYVKMKDAAMAANSIRTFGQALQKSFEEAYDVLWGFYTGLPPSARNLDALGVELDTWYTALTRTVYNPVWIAGYYTTVDSQDILNDLESKGKDIADLVSLSGKEFRENFAREIAVHLKAIRDLKKSLGQAWSPSVSAPEPVCLVLVGGTGRGKTQMVSRLSIDLYQHMEASYKSKFSSPSDLLFSKPADSEFYDGYKDQMVMFVDEAFQSMRGEDRAMEVAQIFKLVNPYSSPFNMAHCDLKNKVTNKSRFVVLTTNCDNWDDFNIVNTDALVRRRDFFVEPVVEKQFANSNGSLNVRLWLEYCHKNGKDSTVPDYAKFRIKGPHGGVLDTISYDQLVAAMISRWRSKNAVFTDGKDLLLSAFKTAKKYQQQAFEPDTILARIDRSSRMHMNAHVRGITLPKVILDALIGEEMNIFEYDRITEKNHMRLYVLLSTISTIGEERVAGIFRELVGHVLVVREPVAIMDLLMSEGLPKHNWATKMKSWFSSVKQSFPWWGWLGLVSVVVGLVSAFGYGAYRLNSKPDKSEGGSSPDQRNRRSNIFRSHRAPAPEAMEVDAVRYYEEEAVVDTVLEEFIPKMLRATLVVHAIDEFGGVVKVTRGLIICSDYVLIPSHLISPPVKSFKFINAAFTVELSRTSLKMVSIGDRWNYDDVTVMKSKVPGKLVGANIVKRFITKEEVSQFEDCYGELLVAGETYKYRKAARIMPQEKYIKMNKIDNTQVGGKFAVMGWAYDIPTHQGDCGSVVLRWDPTKQTKILGIHCAGGMGGSGLGGFGCIVDQEWLNQIIKKLGGGYEYQALELDMPPVDSEDPLIKPSMALIGYVPKEQRVMIPTGASESVPSPFKGIFTPTTLPAVRTVAGADSTLSKVLDKFKRHGPLVDERRVQLITRSLAVKIYLTPNREVKVLSPVEALNHLEDVNSINISSSMGYPWAIDRKKKSHFVKYDGEQFQYAKEEFVSHLEAQIQLMRDGVIPDFIFLNYLKDERLPIEKVQAGKVRLFMAAPFDLTILVRMYFGTFINAIHGLRHKSGIMVGVDPASEWDILAKHLLSLSDSFLGVDFVNFDRTIPIEFLNVFFDVADLYYEADQSKGAGDNRSIRAALRRAVLTPVYQLKFFRYFVVGGNPSGTPGTAEINSFAIEVIVLYVMMEQYTLDYLLKYLYMAAYGDDFVVAVSGGIDLTKFQRSLEYLGMKVTAADKSPEISMQSIKEITFLKRSFRETNQGWRAPLAIGTIKEMLCWKRRGTQEKLDFQQTIHNAIIELKEHNPNEVVDVYIKLVDYCQRYRYDFPVTEHMLEALYYNRVESKWDGTLLQRFAFHIYESVWTNWIVYPKEPVRALDFVGKKITAQFCGIDLARLPFIPKGVFIHVGFRIKGLELTFSDKGVAWVQTRYTPDFEEEVELDGDVIAETVQSYRPYHRIMNNCITWCEEVLQRSGMPPGDRWSRLVKYAAKHYPSALPRYQMQALDEIAEMDRPDIVGGFDAPSGTDVISESTMMYTRPIKALFESPTVLDSVTWKISDTVGTVKSTLYFPDALLLVPQVLSKTAYNDLMRFSVHIVVKAATTIFHQGTLLGVWVPMARHGWPGGRNLTVQAKTAMPHVILNAAQQTVCSITIPFVHLQNLVRVSRPIQTEGVGAFELLVLNSLRGQDTTASATVTILANLTMVELTVPTPLDIRGEWENQTTWFPAFAGFKYPKPLKEQGEDREKSELGVVSGIAARIGSVARLVGGIPVFSGAASVVSSVADAVGGVSKALGLSKPNSIAATQPMIPRPFSCISYVDGLDMSVILGTCAQNHITIDPAHFGSTVDEMNILYVAKTPSIIGTVTWKRDKAAKSNIMIIPVHPYMGLARKVKVGSEEVAAAQVSLMGYVSALFYYWRGSIQIRVQVICTGLHKGTLALCYVPGGASDELPSLAATSHVLFDIAETAEAELTIPFVSKNLYHKVGEVFDVISLADSFATGTFGLYVINQLIMPETVSSQVDLNIWVSAGDDFELCLPTLQHIMVMGYGHENVELSSEGRDPLSPQNPFMPGLGETPSQCNVVVMGEQIDSLREVLKINTKLKKIPIPPLNDSMQYTIPMHEISREGTIDNVLLFDTYYNHIMRIYRFSRGGIRHKLMAPSVDAKLSAIIDSMVDGKSNRWHTQTALEGSPWAMAALRLNPTLEYMVPFYSHQKSMVHGHDPSIRGVTFFLEPLTKINTEGMNLHVYQSVNDDFSAGYLLGPPVLYLKPSPTQRFVNVFKFLQDPPVAVRTLIDGYYKYVPTELVNPLSYPDLKDTKMWGQKMYYKTYIKPAVYVFPKSPKCKFTAGEILAQKAHAETSTKATHLFMAVTNDFDEDTGSYSFDYSGTRAWRNTYLVVELGTNITIKKPRTLEISDGYSGVQISTLAMPDMLDIFGNTSGVYHCNY